MHSRIVRNYLEYAELNFFGGKKGMQISLSLQRRLFQQQRYKRFLAPAAITVVRLAIEHRHLGDE